MSNLSPAKAIEKAKVSIQIDHAFFAFFLSKYTIHIDPTEKTASVDALHNIYIGPEFLARTTEGNHVWTLCHEICHPMLGHFTRQGSREGKKWNFAGDAVINDFLESCGIRHPVPNTVYMPGSCLKLTETVFNELPDSPPSGGSGEWENGLGDDLRPGKALTPDEVKQIETQMKIDTIQAARVAKVRGQLTGKLQEFVDSIIGTQVKWNDHLERYMQELVQSEYSWARPNRRFLDYGYLPSTGKKPKMGTLVVQVDMSGSISEPEARHYGGGVSEMIEQCQPECVYVLYTDSRVKRADRFEFGEEVEFHFFRGGGTDMTAGFRWCDDNDVHPDAFVCLTDGCTPWGEPQSYPVVWCVTTDMKPTHGEHIPFKIEE